MALSDDVTIRAPQLASAADVSGLLSIYDEAIPASERKSHADVKRMLERPDYRVLAAFNKGSLIGFSIICALQGQKLFLLEYMAVRETWRSMGIGSRLFTAGRATMDRHDPMVLEVDSDRFPSADHAQRVARKRFYRRLGCREVAGLVYDLPLGLNPPPMEVLVCWDGPNRVSRETISRWLTGLYVEVYDCRASDPRIAAMVAALPKQVALV